MNFLSHFYFDRFSTDPQIVLGSVLPDLIKNARKDWNIRPEKYPTRFQSIHHHRIMIGWKRHILIDRLFHNSEFFITHSRAIRELITPVFERSEIKAFFVAHIALEIMLDSLLLSDGAVKATDLYHKLEHIDRSALTGFLVLNELDDIGHFISFYDRFLESKYLTGYNQPNSIVFAVSRICMRIWPSALSPTQQSGLETLLLSYRESLNPVFLQIFEEIEVQLKD